MENNENYTGNENLNLRQLNLYGKVIKDYADSKFISKEEFENMSISDPESNIIITEDDANRQMNINFGTENINYFGSQEE